MTGILPPSVRTLSVYRRSLYRLPGLLIKIGCYPEGEFPPWGRAVEHDMVLLSAYNPGGRMRPLGWNRRMMQALERRLKGLPHVYGEGCYRRWHEPLVMVATDARRANRLARLFRQNATVVVAKRKKARLDVLA